MLEMKADMMMREREIPIARQAYCLQRWGGDQKWIANVFLPFMFSITLNNYVIYPRFYLKVVVSNSKLFFLLTFRPFEDISCLTFKIRLEGEHLWQRQFLPNIANSYKTKNINMFLNSLIRSRLSNGCHKQCQTRSKISKFYTTAFENQWLEKGLGE